MTLHTLLADFVLDGRWLERGFIVPIVVGDALSTDPREYLGPERARVVANLPYNIATALLVNWLTAEPWPPWYDSLLLMFQREVAERLWIAIDAARSAGRPLVVTTRIAAQAPLLGSYLTRLLGGEDSIGVVTFARFFGMHVLLLPPATAAAAGEGGGHDLLARGAVGEIGQRRLAGGVLQADLKLALVTVLLRGVGGGGDLGVTEAGEFLAVAAAC
jgi:hypothetical protein